MSDAVSRKALLDLLESEIKDGDETWSGAMKWVAYQVETGRVPSLPPEGAEGDGWKVCPACGEDYRAGEEVVIGSAEGRYREALERIIDVLADDTSIRAQRINNIIITALSPSGEQEEETNHE